MLFTTSAFWVFFVVVFLALTANCRLIKSVKLQNVIVLLASYYFYASWDWRFLSLIILSTLVDYTAALKIEQATNQTRRKTFLWISIASNLGILGVFKYFNFFSAELLSLLGHFGVTPTWTTLNIILPVGISFYTFQTITYTADVYWKRMNSDRDLIKYAAYVAFFPQLVAGPIERARNLLPQFSTLRTTSWSRVYQGVNLIVFGLFLKVVVADNLAPIVDEVFAEPSSYSGFVLALGAIYFGTQIYCDFCGYSTIAIGVATVLGFDLMTNFRTPYFATSIQEFWRRWHISLSTFFRDYVYIPLGGSRGPGLKTAQNLMITFVVSGLWHGANWTFIVWGGIHGVLLVLERYLAPVLQVVPILKIKLLARLYTLCAVAVCWIVFRSTDLSSAVQTIQKIIWEFDIPSLGQSVGIIYTYGIGVLFVLLMLISDLLWRNDVRLEGGLALRALPANLAQLAESLIFAVMITLVICFSYFNGTDNAFIYFQF